MKRLSVIIICTALACAGCSKKEQDTVLQKLLDRWARSTRELNYREYVKSEAVPRSSQVFREMYRHYYLADIMVMESDDPESAAERKGPDGMNILAREVNFECTEVQRNTSKPSSLVRGNVTVIRFTEGERKNDGWLLWNRSIVRIKR